MLVVVVIVLVMMVVVVVVGNADTATRVCEVMSNAMSTPEIEVENIMNRRQVIRRSFEVFDWLKLGRLVHC